MKILFSELNETAKDIEEVISKAKELKKEKKLTYEKLADTLEITNLAGLIQVMNGKMINRPILNKLSIWVINNGK